MKMRTQRLGQEPRGDMEVLVVGFGQPPAVRTGIVERRRHIGDSIGSRQRRPSTLNKRIIGRLQRCSGHDLARGRKGAPLSDPNLLQLKALWTMQKFHALSYLLYLVTEPESRSSRVFVRCLAPPQQNAASIAPLNPASSV